MLLRRRDRSERANAKICEFYGREELLQSICDGIFAASRGTVDSTSPLAGITLCLIGNSGCGKTALMAKAASEVYRLQPDKERPVIIRFCGTSGGSSTALSLVKSICLQIHFTLHLTANTDILQLNYADAVDHFHKLLNEHAVVLFIDSLDQLKNENLGRSDISFLKGVRPHVKTKIIVSALPDELSKGEVILK